MVLTNVSAPRSRSARRSTRSASAQGHLLLTELGRRPPRAPGSLYSRDEGAVTAMGEALRQELNGTGVRVTLIEPGMVDTPFFDNRRRAARWRPTTSPRAVMFAVTQPPHVDVNEILVRPTAQDG